MKQEAKIVITAQDRASAELAAIQAKFENMLAPVRRLTDSLQAPIRAVGLDNVANRLGGVKNAMAGVPVAGALFATGGVAMATGALIQNSIAAHDLLGNLQDLKDKFKVSTEAMQVYGEVGKDANVSQETIARGFMKLQGKIADALGGGKESIEAFNAVGINKKDLEGGSLEVFKKISDLYKSKDFDAADPFKIQSAVDVFGKSGIELIAVLEQGGAVYGDTLKRLNDSGLLFNEEQISAADNVGDAFGRAMRKIDGLKTAVGLTMSPLLEAITKSINDMMDGGARSEILNTFKKLGDTLAQEAPKFIAHIPSIIDGLSGIITGINKIGSFAGWDKIVLGGLLFIASPFIASTITMTAAIGKLAISLGVTIAKIGVLAASNIVGFLSVAKIGVVGLQASFTQMGFSAAASWALTLAPITLIVAGIAAVGAAIYFVYKNLDGFAAFFVGVWDGMGESLKPLGVAFAPIIDAVKSAFGWLGNLFGVTNQGAQSWKAWGDAGKTAGEVIGFAIKGVLTPLFILYDALKLIVASVSFISGNGFNFESTTQQVWQGGAAKQDVGGKLDVRIKSDGTPVVERVESNNSNFTIDAMAGYMVGA